MTKFPFFFWYLVILLALSSNQIIPILKPKFVRWVWEANVSFFRKALSGTLKFTFCKSLWQSISLNRNITSKYSLPIASSFNHVTLYMFVYKCGTNIKNVILLNIKNICHKILRYFLPFAKRTYELIFST